MTEVYYIAVGYPGPYTADKYNEFYYGKHILNHLQNLAGLNFRCKASFMINDFVGGNSFLDNNSHEYRNAITSKEVDYYNSVLKFIKPIIDIKFRPNKDISYGALIDAFLRRDKDYDRYIITECDYSFCQNDFDINLSNLQDKLGLDAMFMMWDKTYHHDYHGAMTTSIISHKAFYETVYKFENEMRKGQYEFTRAFHEAGFKCGDWRSFYKAEFYNSLTNSINDFSFPNVSKRICIPNQMLGELI